MHKHPQRISVCAAVVVFLLVAVTPRLGVRAQNSELQERMAQLKESTAQNKQKLAQYTYVEQVTISLKGEEKKQEKYQVKTGPDGKPVKTPINSSPAPATASQNSGGRGGRLKEHVVEKKKEEYKDYADRMKALMQRYVPPDKELLQQAVQNHNVKLDPVAGSSSQVKLVFHDYVKPKDSMTLIFDKEQKQVVGLQIASYLDDPSDAVNLAVKMARLPDGVSHVDSVVLDGVSKQIKVAIQNSNYQHL